MKEIERSNRQEPVYDDQDKNIKLWNEKNSENLKLQLLIIMWHIFVTVE